MPRISESERGFTLLELVIALAIFMVILIILGGMVLGAVRAQRVAIATQQVQDTLRSALEILGRDIRLAAKNTTASSCVPARADFSPSSGESSSLTFISDRGKCLKYSLSNQQVHRLIDGATDEVLTSDNALITALNFNIFGEGNDQTQPRIVVRLAAQSKTSNQVTMQVETTLAQRELDVQ